MVSIIHSSSVADQLTIFLAYYVPWVRTTLKEPLFTYAGHIVFFTEID